MKTFIVLALTLFIPFFHASAAENFDDISVSFTEFVNTLDETEMNMDEYHALGWLDAAIQSEDTVDTKDANKHVFDTLTVITTSKRKDAYEKMDTLIQEL